METLNRPTGTVRSTGSGPASMITDRPRATVGPLAETVALTRPGFEALASWAPDRSDPLAVTMYLPVTPGRTHEAGIEARRLVRDAHQRLVEMEIDPSVAADLLAPLQDAAERVTGAGTELRDARGLAVFSSLGHIAALWTRSAPPALVSCGSGFTLTPLLASLPPAGTFDLLAISKRRNRLFRGNSEGLRPIRLSAMPAAIDEALFSDDHRRGVNAHGGARVGQGRVTSISRSQGSDRDTRDERLLRYFRLVDDAVRAFTSFSRRPLIVAGPAYELAIYRSATRMRRLDTIAVGSTDRLGPDALYRRCAPMVNAVLDRPRQAAIGHLDRVLVATSVHEILAAIEQSRVDTVFVRPDRLEWADDDTAGWSARELHSEAISAALRDGAHVYPADAGELPDDASIAATLRF